jgi:hypothetical protein
MAIVREKERKQQRERDVKLEHERALVREREREYEQKRAQCEQSLMQAHRLWQLVHGGFRQHWQWSDSKFETQCKHKFHVFDTIVVDCMQSIIECLSRSSERNMNCHSQHNNNEFVYSCLDDDVIDAWSADITALVPVLREYLARIEYIKQN